MKVHAFRLKPGEDLRRSLETFLAEHQIRAAVMISCVGSLRKVPFRFAGETGTTLLSGKFEIVSMEGMLSVNGCHLHCAVADSLGITTGGHLQYGSEIYTTSEVVIGELPGVEFTREMDAETGCQELVVRQTGHRQ